MDEGRLEVAKKAKDYDAVMGLLAALREARDSDEYAETFAQELAKPERKAKTISSLATQAWPLSPQLAARFDFGGQWKNHFPGLEWLSLTEMNKARAKKSYRELIANREEYWDGSILQTNPRSHVSLFGVDVADASEVYLAWTDDRVEPRIVWYVAQHSHEFDDLIGYLQYLVPKKRANKKSTPKRNR
jgi:hypothetical protein